MDRLKRVTRLDEFKEGWQYFWLKGNVRRGSFTCVAVCFKENMVKMQARMGEPHWVLGWSHRYISDAHAAESSLLFPAEHRSKSEPLGDRHHTTVVMHDYGVYRPLKVMVEIMLSNRLARSRVRPYGRKCGNCESYDALIGLCGSDKNQGKFGDKLHTEEVGWCQWWEYDMRKLQ